MKCLPTKLVIAAFFPIICACSSGTSPAPTPTRADCEQLRAHVAELRLSDELSKPDVAEMDMHRAIVIANLGNEFVEACRIDHSPAYVECALEATSRGEIRRCP